MLRGEAGFDTLNGGAGNDTLIGGLGRDTLWGGADKDRFVWASTAESGALLSDRVTDFQRGIDTLDLAAIDANTLVAGNQAFVLSGTGKVTGKAGRREDSLAALVRHRGGTAPTCSTMRR